MMWVKICGLTNLQDALAASAAGADALGFIFAERSKRLADPKVVAKIKAELSPFATLVGVFQNQPPGYVNDIMGECGLHMAQLHGDEARDYFDKIGYPILKAFSMATEADLEKVKDFGLPGFILDSGTGGTGKVFDWSLAIKAKKYGRVILAGGLTPENVAEAVRTVRPWGVDTAGGVEASYGIKDHEKIRKFIRAAKEAAL